MGPQSSIPGRLCCPGHWLVCLPGSFSCFHGSGSWESPGESVTVAFALHWLSLMLHFPVAVCPRVSSSSSFCLLLVSVIAVKYTHHEL